MKVVCSLPNASLNINGVAFEVHPDGVVSVEDLSQAVADKFLAVPGFSDAAAKKPNGRKTAKALLDAAGGSGDGGDAEVSTNEPVTASS